MKPVKVAQPRPRPRRRPRERATVPAPQTVPAGVLRAVSAVLTIEVFLQQWGRIIHDTRTDLAIDPARFLSNSLHLWDPMADMGRIQNQIVGYLVPMGPVFLVGHLLALPTWIVQRTWIALVLCVALWGFARLADAFEIGTVTWRVTAAVAYALSPYFVARGATLSAFVIAAALLPWAMTPLVRGSRGGSPRRAACASAVAIFLMGGVNAAVTIAVLVVPALYLVTRQRGRRRARLIRWWCLTTSIVCAWWFGALVFQDAYGVNFLVFTERAALTTGFTPPFEVIRGTADWLSYVHLWNAPLPAGFALVSNALLVLATALLAAAGLYGLVRRDLPERTFLVVCFLVGVAAVGIGYGGVLGNPAAAQSRSLLDGPLAIFRTVYKFQPIVTLPLALGFVHAGSWVSESVRRSTCQAGWGVVVVPVAAMGTILVAVGPVLAGTMASNGGFTSVPAYWTEARQFLDEHGGRTLEVPGLPIADFTWGIPQDEPFNWDSSTPWATRSTAPLGSPAATRYLDSIESAIGRGGSEGLAAALRSGGFSTVTVRSDGFWQKYVAPSPPLVSDALIASGLHRIGSFGSPLAFTDQVNPSHADIHQIDVYAVDGSRDVEAYNLADAAVLSGGPESPMALAATGAAANRGYILAGDLNGLSQTPPNWIVTDGNRRRFNYFGLNRDNASYVLSPTDGSPNAQPLSAGLLPSDRVENQTVASLHGVRSVTASSSGSWLFAIPESAPYQALDGNPATAWASGPKGTSVGEWLQVDLDAPTSTPTIDVQLLEDGPWRPRVNSLRVTTAAGEIVDAVRPDESKQTIALPPGKTSWVRVTFAKATTATTQSAGAGIRELAIPGVSVVRRLMTPSELTDPYRNPGMPLPDYSFQRAQTNPHSLLRADEDTNIDRQFNVPHDGTAKMTVRVSARPNPSLQSLLNVAEPSRDPNTIWVAATSALRDLPEFASRNLLDGNPATVWVAARATAIGDSSNPIVAQPDDPDPHISLNWKERRSIDSLRIDPASGYSTPVRVNVNDGKETREGAVEPDGTVRFDPPIKTDHLDLRFPVVNRVAVLTGDPTRDKHPLARPVGLAGIEVPALSDLHSAAPGPSVPLHIPCDAGPVVRLNDRDIHLAIDTDIRTLMSLATVPAKVCGDPVVALNAGANTLDTRAGSGAFNVTSVSLRDSQHPLPELHPTRSVAKLDWSSSARSAQIGPGAATYLAINENVNKGWVATFDGRQLEPTILDGWRQAFVVPAGAGGVIHLRYKPDTAYHAVLIVGFLVALIPFILLVLPGRRDDLEPPAPEGQWATSLLWLASIACALAFAGAGVLLLLPLWFVGRRWPRGFPLLAAGAYLLATLCVTVTVQPFRDSWRGAFGWPATVLSVVAVMVMAASLLIESGAPRAHRGDNNRNQQ